jgi:hypothetical protein
MNGMRNLELWKLEIGVAVRPDYNKMRGKVFQFLFSTCFIYAQTTMHFSEMR